MSSTHERLREKWLLLPSEELMRRLADGRISKDFAPVARLIIEERETKASASSEAARIEREEEILRIARDANSLAREAISVSRREARYAMYAAVIATVAAAASMKAEIYALIANTP